MKRSQLIKKINKEIVDHFLTCDNITGVLCESATNRILEIIEDVGMLPPGIIGEINVATIKSIDTEDKSITLFTEGQSFGLVNEWEKE